MSDLFNSEDKVIESSQPLFTGLCKVKPVILNPTLQEAEEMGLNMRKEATYFKIDDGKERIQYDFHVQLPQKDDQGTHYTTKVTFFVNNEIRTSQNTGKVQVTNNFGQYTWVNPEETASEKYTWFKNNGEREAFSGEEDLVNFIRMWGNAENDQEIPFDFPKAFAKGEPMNTSEYSRHIIKQGNRVEVLLIVTKGQYQGVFTGTFGRGNVNNVNKFNKAINDLVAYYQKNNKSMKFDFQETLKLQEYDPKPIDMGTSTEEPKPTGETFNEDELPF